MPKQQTIGVIGGMGPEATNRLCQLITELTDAGCDQSHIPVICFNNSAIPSRVDAIFCGAASPLPELVLTAKTLIRAGADFLLMPCNTAHFYFAELQRTVSAPIVNMIEETTLHICEATPALKTVGLLASSPTIECGLYHKALSGSGVSVVVPDSQMQNDCVMQSIFGPKGIKAGHQAEPKEQLIEAGMRLVAKGAQAVIAGCTEVSVVLAGDDVPFAVIDPLEVIARVAIRRARNGSAFQRSDRLYAKSAVLV